MVAKVSIPAQQLFKILRYDVRIADLFTDENQKKLKAFATCDDLDKLFAIEQLMDLYTGIQLPLSERNSKVVLVEVDIELIGRAIREKLVDEVLNFKLKSSKSTKEKTEAEE